MGFRFYQLGELIGIALLLGSTATQMFYLDPLKREIEWRLAAFSIQQSAQVQIKAVHDNRIILLQALNVPAEKIKEAETARDESLNRFKTADANISDFMIAKESVEDNLQYIVLALFALGTLLAGFGRAMEMRTHRD
ncbi:hypothetical protein [Hyphomicrobium sp.]|jgi:hypothetical protein|uniref:hypothetical protein n=1 Tax=Hyphomicrobium sp. TaxID=82 RepID=UPI002B7E0476|nr:hypothetical protein [Hyphomicrobium sp.]HVZ04632.1 hypothetical protein [Hyphomicrobium sp.]